MKTIVALFIFSSMLFAQTPKSENPEKKEEAKYSNICFVADMGSGNDVQKKIFQSMIDQNCHQVRIAGDILYPDGIETYKDEHLVSNFINPTKALRGRAMIFMVAGNHDYHKQPMEWVQVAAKYDGFYMPEVYYGERYGDNCFLAIDTTPLVKLRYLFRRKRQKAWIIDSLNKMKDCKLKIVWGHHPYLSSGEHGDADGEFKEFFEKNILGKVDYYISGHDHILSDEGKVQGTQLYVVGGGGISRYQVKRPGVDRFVKSSYGYLKLKLIDLESKIESAEFIEIP